ncbi:MULTISPECIES: outer membrane lipoprotein chaperone LolA [Photorhabdus]|uniref:outer membrane lipoprotein chaperone LolA n=1 Tax=Photorhabdus TaxID=29487 RepID=UPI000DCB6BDC|nr:MULTISPECIES: outer membrane lipoprotein chaperone LolA [Photorhabdus]MCT8343945.1 outer membrane lipoprotein chaperone LolA [Photorhabdus kleinii]RAW95120.1 outer-membrane lipoprotein carrier protein LolA [Photorhabdus sp. S9-53]RAW95287.1 outer-membrane lipoprotein carrier protein LolA [Photorhabdus sp. S10-54]RAW99413.1 outer-membrane lipoprotein carrier protein LolA [Photorhabdus sp. S8-52]
MKKLILIGCLMVGMNINVAWANASQNLQERLGKVNSFHASFTQTVTSDDGATIQEGEGQLWVKRPNLFNWHMTSPDESVLVSDGKTLWFYNPFVEQVTANWLKDATGNTPFMLITRNDAKDWSQYKISQQGNDFELTPNNVTGNLKRFSITVTMDGTIQKFSAIEQDGQKSAYQLKGQQNTHVDAAKFSFTLPKGVTLDDQRQ